MSYTWWVKRLGAVWVALLFGLNYIAYRSLKTSEGKLLDLRPQGYSLEKAAEYAFSLTIYQRDEYAYAYLWLDYVFIACTFAILLLVALSLPRPWSVVAGVCAVVFAICDVVENTLVRRILMMPAFIEFEVWRVTVASLATQAKFASLTLAVVSALIGWRRKGKP